MSGKQDKRKRTGSGNAASPKPDVRAEKRAQFEQPRSRTTLHVVLAVVALVADMEMRGLSGGGLPNSAAAEALTSILIYMNKTYGADGAGVRFTGLTKAPAI